MDSERSPFLSEEAPADLGGPSLNSAQGAISPQAGLTDKAPKGLGAVFESFVKSNFFRPIIIALLLGGFLIGLGVYVFNNLGSVGGGGEIVWWGLQHDESVYAPLIAQFESENPNIRIKYEKQSTSDYRERLANALGSGAGPDIYEIHNSWPYMFGRFLDKMPNSVWSADDYKKSFYPVVTSNFTFGGGIVAVPLEYDALTLFINEEIFAAGAKEPPISWDELRDLAENLTQKDGRGIIVQSGVALGNSKNIDYWPEVVSLMMLQNHVNPVKPAGSFAQDVMSFYIMFDKKTWDESLPPSTEAFAKGKLAMYFAPSREATNIVKINPNLRFRTVPLPQLAKNSPQDPDVTYASYWAMAVSERSKKSDAAWRFLKFMATDESLKKINENVGKSETFGRVSPRPGMNITIREDNLLGSLVALAPSAGTSLLADKTNDGETGLNTKVNKAYKALIDRGKGVSPSNIEDLAKNLKLILSEYGISLNK